MLSKTSYAFKVLKYLFEMMNDVTSGVDGLYFDRTYSCNPLARKKYLHDQKQGRFNITKVFNAVSYLKKKEYLAKKKEKFYFTKKAVNLLLSDELEEKALKKIAGKWDGKWRILFFDIPEKERFKRDILRGVIKRLGFNKCQQSVWVCSYPVADELREISRIFSMESYIVLLESDNVLLGEDFFQELIRSKLNS